MIEISVIIIRIIFLLIPGIIGKYIFDLLTGKKNHKEYDSFIEIFVISIISYFIYGLVINSLFKNNTLIFDLLFDDTKKIIFKDIFIDIFFTTVISIIFVVILTIFYNYNLINKIAQFVKITIRYGNHDLWDHFHRDKKNKWIIVRDHKTNLIYYGSVKYFSENNEKRELIMEDVSVYTNVIQKKGRNKLYELESLYISRDDFDLTIEIMKN